MSQTPLSPVEKRMRTSLDASTSTSKSNGESSPQDSQRPRRSSPRAESNILDPPRDETSPEVEQMIDEDSSSSSSSDSSDQDSDEMANHIDGWSVDWINIRGRRIPDFEFDSSLDADSIIGQPRSSMDYGDLIFEDYIRFDPTPKTKYPRPDWTSVHQLRLRRLGLPSRVGNCGVQPRQWNPTYFQKYTNYSLWTLQRLEQNQTLEHHTGCVNSIDFNSSGKLLCSAGDDLNIDIWDWQTNTLKKSINSGHLRNIFHSQFCQSDQNIITSSRDGLVKLTDIETCQSRDLLRQSGEIYKLSFIAPQTVVTCSTTGAVHLIDFRDQPKNRRLFRVRSTSNQRKFTLNTITSHPNDRLKIAIGGQDPYVHLYDLRRVSANLDDFDVKLVYYNEETTDTDNQITDIAYNSTGQYLLISYSCGDLIVCHSQTCEVLHRYRGHRNDKTIKNCAWYGDNYVLSGSDDGHIYGWDFESEHIVCFLDADQTGIVNTLCVHPSLPVLASSGLDPTVKIWEPTSDWPHVMKGIKPHICYNSMRRQRLEEDRTQAQNGIGAGNGEFMFYSDDSDDSEDELD